MGDTLAPQVNMSRFNAAKGGWELEPPRGCRDPRNHTTRKLPRKA
jgi:hypothetical protein